VGKRALMQDSAESWPLKRSRRKDACSAWRYVIFLSCIISIIFQKGQKQKTEGQSRGIS